MNVMTLKENENSESEETGGTITVLKKYLKIYSERHIWQIYSHGYNSIIVENENIYLFVYF